MGKKYIVYTRTSTKDQHTGIDAQRRAVQNFIKKDDEIIREYTEHESGRNTERPELEAAIKDCNTFGYTLLIARLDRLSRSAKFTLELLDTKVAFTCCDMPDANPMTIGIMAVLAQSEAERISRNTKESLEELKARGVKLGNTKNLTDEQRRKNAQKQKEQAIKDNRAATELIMMYREAKRTYEWIANRLNEKGFNTIKRKKGGVIQKGTFSKGSVKRLYDRAKSMGYML